MKSIVTKLFGIALLIVGAPLLAESSAGAVEATYSAPVSYPRAALINREEGQVVVQYTVNRRGRAKNVEVIQSTNDVFNQAAIDAVRNSRFTRAYEEGEVVEVAGLQKQFNFKLD